MKTSVEQFEKWLKSSEDFDLEFKEAKSNFSKDRGSLNDYCAAIANGSGGKLILGVKESPRKVVGTTFHAGTYTKLSHELWEALRIHIDVEEFVYQGSRVLIFHIPQHPAGGRVKSGGKGDKYTYPIRRGESLGEMDDQRTKEILNEIQSDYSAECINGLLMDDLDDEAVEFFRQKWAKKLNNDKYLEFDNTKILKNTGLITNQGVTRAGLILVGKEDSLQRFLPDAEIVFEWRQQSKQTNFDFRKNWRAPFLKLDDEIWQTINARNLRIPFQEGFFQRDVWAFHEKSIREAVHNAVMHRDYSVRGQSIFIKASPDSFVIESPGGFYPPVTIKNCLQEKSWRNRLLAEAMEKVGFVERSSQGLDDIFEQSIRDGKGVPDFNKSKSYSVILSIPAQVKDKDFILYLERVSNDRQISLSFEEICELENIREKQKVSTPEFKEKFIQLGIIESIGKGRGTRYILSQKYYETIGESGRHTRIKGLTRDRVKELILNHIKDGKSCNVSNLKGAFPEYSPKDFTNMLQELKRDGKIYFEGKSKQNGLWKI